MKTRRSPGSSLRRSALLCATVLAPCGPLAAQAVVRTGVDVSAEAEATSNPYLDENSSDIVGAGSIEVRPWLVRETARDRIELEGFARGRAFTGRFPFEDSFGASLGATHRASPRTNYYGQANVLSTSARSNFSRFNRGGFTAPLGPADPATPIDPATGLGPIILPPLDDITIVGLQGRSTTLSTSAGVNRQFGTRSSLNVGIDYNRLWVSGNQLADYDSVRVNAGYSRRLNARTTAGVSLSAGQTRFEGPLPKTTTLGAFVNVEHQLDQNWSLNGSVGVSHSRSPAFGILPEVDQTGLAGNLGVCRVQNQSRLCFGASRSQQPSSFGQVRTTESLDLTYGEQISARDRVDLYANYARSISPREIDTPFDEVEIASVGGTFTRTLNERLDGYVFGRASRSYGGYLSDEPSLAVGIGIRARFGDRR